MTWQDGLPLFCEGVVPYVSPVDPVGGCRHQHGLVRDEGREEHAKVECVDGRDDAVPPPLALLMQSVIALLWTSL